MKKINGRIVEELPTLTIKEALFICRYARKYGLESCVRPSHELQHFNSVKVWFTGGFDKEMIYFIKSNFLKQYKCELYFEDVTNKDDAISRGYFYKIKFKQDNE